MPYSLLVRLCDLCDHGSNGYDPGAHLKTVPTIHYIAVTELIKTRHACVAFRSETCAILKYVSDWHVCRSDKCAFLKHLSSSQVPCRSRMLKGDIKV